MKQVALLGGSFNPPHIGHLLAATYMRAVMGSDEVWLVPSFHHPFGKALEAFDDRVALCQSMADSVGTWLKVSTEEQNVPGDGRTIDLLEYLLPKFPEVTFSFVIGSDILADVPRWKSWDRIQQLVKVVVLYRAGYPAPEAIGPPLAEASSTAIRQMFERGELPTKLVPQATLRCAQERGLFGLR